MHFQKAIVVFAPFEMNTSFANGPSISAKRKGRAAPTAINCLATQTRFSQHPIPSFNLEARSGASVISVCCILMAFVRNSEDCEQVQPRAVVTKITVCQIMPEVL